MTGSRPGGYEGRKVKINMISEWYQILYSLGRKRWFIYKIVRYENLHETIDTVLKIDGVEEIKIEIMPDTEDDEI